MMHWAFKYIGMPWVRGENDCWAFFRLVQQEQFGRLIPQFDMERYNRSACIAAVEHNPERNNWRLVEKPQEGDAVLLAHARHPSHVGVWVDVDGGGVLHCVGGSGVVFQTVKSLKSGGWGHVEFYRHV